MTVSGLKRESLYRWDGVFLVNKIVQWDILDRLRNENIKPASNTNN